MQRLLVLVPSLFCALLMMAATAQAQHSSVVTFDNGMEGWNAPQGIGGFSQIQPTGGNPGAHLYTVFNNFGIEYSTNSNSAFVGDYTQFGSVTLGLDLRVENIEFFGTPATRDLIVELRSYSLAQGGYPYSSVWFTLTTMASGQDWATYSVTIDNPNSTTMPPGWGGYGDEDPNTFEPILPSNLTFADIMANVEEVAFSTYVPGFFFGFTDFELRLDNLRITTTPIPEPASLALLPLLGLALLRRRKR